MKKILEEAMMAYVKEMDFVCMKINDAHTRAVNAAHRGDEIGYQKQQNSILRLGKELEKMNMELDKIKAAYAAI